MADLDKLAALERAEAELADTKERLEHGIEHALQLNNELADYREALEQIDTYADNEPFDPKRAYFADVRKIARDALARYRVTKETQT